jgi:PAS domain S-box-containing protein
VAVRFFQPLAHKWSLVLLLIGFLLSVLLAVETHRANEGQLETATSTLTNQITDQIQRRIELYQYGLRGARGAILTAGPRNVSRRDFKKYSATRDVDVEFPGATGFGYILRVKPDEEAEFVRAAKEDDWPDFTITQLSPHNDERYIIKYIEPVESNMAAVGLDIASEDNRRSAAKKAILTGNVQLTGPITLVQATGQPFQAFLILMPIYQSIETPETEELREEFGFGWSYAPLISSNMLEGITIDSSRYLVELFDVTDASNEERFFTSSTETDDVVYSQFVQKSVYGREWEFRIGVRPQFIKDLNQLNEWAVAGIGFLFSLVIAGLIGSLLISRENKQIAIEEQSKLAAIVSSSADGIIRLSTNGKITSWNAGAINILGYSASEAIGRDHAKLLVPAHLISQSNEHLAQVLKGKVVSSHETIRTHKNGNNVHVSITLSPILGEQDAIIAISETIRDITQQKKSEALIHELNASLESQVAERTAEAIHVRDQLLLASEAAELGIWVWAVADNKLQWNDKMIELYGYPLSIREQGIEYSHWYDRLHPEDRDATADMLNQALAGGPQFKTEFRIICPDGMVRYLHTVALIEVDESGQPITVTGVNRDVTAEVMSEQSLIHAKQMADQANTAKSHFLANMSHELRTPMNAVLGMLTLVKNTGLDNQQSDYITKCEVSAKSLLSVLNDILDYSKIDAGKLELDHHDFEIDSMFQELSTILTGVKKNEAVELLFDIDPSLPSVIFGDRLRLLQVLINLSTNALKFTEQGQVIIGICQQSQSDKTSKILIRVKDSGIGISPENQKKIFSGFSQAEASTARQYGGTGLGLTISKTLVEMMGGELKLMSEEGMGSQFYFELEFETNVNPIMIGPNKQLDLKVLLVDSHPISTELFRNTLESICTTVDIVDTGVDAIRVIQQNDEQGKPFDLVFIDSNIGESELAETLQASQQLDNQPAMILVASFGGDEPLNGIGISENGPLIYRLMKPATPNQVSKLIDRIQPRGKQNLPKEDLPTVMKERLNTMKLLLVEDNELNRQIAVELLKMEGAEVTVAEGGLRGVELVSQNPQAFDAVLMDMQMPDIDGLEATRRIRALNATKRLPIIAMTANVSAQDIHDCLSAGMNAHIAKPLDLDNMVHTIKNCQSTVKLGEIETIEVDIQAVLKRLAGNRQLLIQVLEAFGENSDTLLGQLEQQRTLKDPAAMKQTLHSLKGSAANVGATHLAAKVVEMELLIEDAEPRNRIDIIGMLDIASLRELSILEVRLLREALAELQL